MQAWVICKRCETRVQTMVYLAPCDHGHLHFDAFCPGEVELITVWSQAHEGPYTLESGYHL